METAIKYDYESVRNSLSYATTCCYRPNFETLLKKVACFINEHIRESWCRENIGDHLHVDIILKFNTNAPCFFISGTVYTLSMFEFT